MLNKKTRIEKISIKNIEIDDSISFRDRWSNSKADGALLMSISDVGLIIPIIVRPTNSNGKYSLIKGYRRLTAMKKLGYEQITCEIVEMDDCEAIGVFYSSFLGCKDLSYEQIKNTVHVFRELINGDNNNGLNEFVDNIERNNQLPEPMTNPYYCSWCKRNHVRGKIYKDHMVYRKGVD